MLVFIDESGHPEPNDSTEKPVLLGVCINENDIKPITNQIYKLKDDIYGKQDEIKTTKLIREQTITKNVLILNTNINRLSLRSFTHSTFEFFG
ncbi:MAG: DUF3800 domain-containing protein [Clostridiaceae bacterium]|nr:DUF3800 domain-containing protein [Clostridiaceae bacterium]